MPALSLPYQSAAGPTVHYPAGWLLRNFPRRESGGTVYFEYVNVASATFRKAPMYARLVFGSTGDYSFYDRQQLIGKARNSAKKAFKWKTAFGGAFPINVSGQPGFAENFVWFIKKNYHGLGFAFAARNAATHRWIYGWAEYDTWDKGKVRPDASRSAARRSSRSCGRSAGPPRSAQPHRGTTAAGPVRLREPPRRPRRSRSAGLASAGAPALAAGRNVGWGLGEGCPPPRDVSAATLVQIISKIRW